MLDYLEAQSFDSILTALLERVPDDVDKREGSVIYDALAPSALKLAETYWDMAVLYRRTFAATADGDDLEKRVNEHGVERKKQVRLFVVLCLQMVMDNHLMCQ